MMNEAKIEPHDMECPNGCGDMEYAYGNIEDNNRRTYWEVSIRYCPKCMYFDEVNADL